MTRPTAAPARFPYREHRTMAQVMRREAAAAIGHEANRKARLRKRADLVDYGSPFMVRA